MRVKILAVARQGPEWLIGIRLLLAVTETGEHGLGDGRQHFKDPEQVAEIANVDELEHLARNQLQQLLVG